MQVFVTVPRKVKGGVANYFQVLKEYLPAHINYISRGAATDESSILSKGKRLTGDYLSFVKCLLKDHSNIIHINTSLGHGSLYRDLLYVYIAKRLGKKVVLFIHGWNRDFEESFFNNKNFYKQLFFKCDAYIVLANDFKKVLKGYGVNTPIYTLTTLIDDRIIEESTVSKKFGNPVTILYLSRIEKEKGIIESIEAFTDILEKYPAARLNIAGSGSYLEKTKAYVHENNIANIFFLGYVSGKEKNEAFRNADIYLFPSYYGEGMPTTVLEAMGWGLPVVTRPVGGLKDFFINEKMGYITESKSPRQIAVLLRKLLDNEENLKLISRYNKAYAKEYFTASAVAKKILKIYESIL